MAGFRHHTYQVTFALWRRRRAGRALLVGTSDERCDVTLVAREVTNRVLLMAGIAAVVVYVIGDLLSALLYNGYSYLDQAISELSAFGSPVRPLMVTVILIHGLLVLAFGVGVLRASSRRSLSWVGGL